MLAPPHAVPGDAGTQENHFNGDLVNSYAELLSDGVRAPELDGLLTLVMFHRRGWVAQCVVDIVLFPCPSNVDSPGLKAAQWSKWSEPTLNS